MTDSTNDNDILRLASRPDAHGQAAMLLVESLLHTLIARSVLQLEDAVDVVTVAIDAKTEIAADLGQTDDSSDVSQALLRAIRWSLTGDI